MFVLALPSGNAEALLRKAFLIIVIISYVLARDALA